MSYRLLLQHGASLTTVNKHGYTALHETSYTEFSQVLLDAKQDVNYKSGGKKLTPLHRAADLGQLNKVKFLIEKGANVNARSCHGKTPLFFASTSDVCKLLIDKGADITITDTYSAHNHTALHWARNAEVAACLLDHGSDINALNGCKQPPIRTAIQHKFCDVVRLFLDRGVPLDIVDPQKRTLLHSAVNMSSLPCVQLLLSRGSDIEAQDNEGRTPIFFASDVDIFNFLMDHNANLNHLDFSHQLPIFGVIEYDASEVVGLMLERGVDVNHRSDVGFTPMHQAAEFSCVTVAELLVEKGADINATDDSGSLPLHFADADMCYYLVKNGSFVDCRNAQGETPLIRNAYTENTHILETLIELGADVNAKDSKGVTALHAAASEDICDSFAPLIYAGANITATDDQGNTPLQVAVINGLPDTILALLDTKVPVDCIGSGELLTALHTAAYMNSTEEADILIEAGADIEFSNEEGDTALHIASRAGSTEMATKLIRADADVNALDKNRFAPLHLAAAGGHLDIISELVEHKANIHAVDVVGQCPVHLAAANGHCKALELLVVCSMLHDKNRKYVHADAQGTNGFASLEDEFSKLSNDNASARIRKHFDTFITDDSYNYTPLYVAAKNKQKEVTKLLMLTAAEIDWPFRWIINRNDPELTQIVDYACFKILELFLYCEIGINDIFVWSASRGNKELCKLILRKPAADNDIAEALESLLIERKVGLNLEYRDNDGFTALLKACKFGLYSLVKLLIENGCDPLAVHGSGTTALHLAASQRSPDLLNLLITSGNDINAIDGKGLTPLHLSIGHAKETRMLISLGSNINAQDNEGNTPLHLAAENNVIESCKALVNAGANPKLVNSKGQLASALATSKVVQGIIEKAVDNYSLLEKPAIDMFSGFVHLFTAVVNGNLNDVTKILQSQQKLDTSSKFFLQLVQMALDNRHKEVAIYLLRNVADIEPHRQLLNSAIEAGFCSVVEMMLNRGCKVNLFDQIAKIPSPLEVAYVSNNDKIIKFLLEKGADINTCFSSVPILLRAIMDNRRELTLLLLSYKPDARSVLFAIAQNNSLAWSIPFLVEHSDPVLQSIALHIAITEKCKDCVLRFVENGVDTELCNDIEETASSLIRKNFGNEFFEVCIVRRYAKIFSNKIVSFTALPAIIADDIASFVYSK